MILSLPSVALGGALGAVLRFLATAIAPSPWGTFAVNVAGSFAIGLLVVWLPPRAMPLLITGVLGGFTTFSTFSLDVVRLLEDGRLGVALLYLGGSVGLSILACAVGLWIGRLA